MKFLKRLAFKLGFVPMFFIFLVPRAHSPVPVLCFINIPPHENARNSFNVFHLHFYELFDKLFLKSIYRDWANSWQFLLYRLL